MLSRVPTSKVSRPTIPGVFSCVEAGVGFSGGLAPVEGPLVILDPDPVGGSARKPDGRFLGVRGRLTQVAREIVVTGRGDSANRRHSGVPCDRDSGRLDLVQVVDPTRDSDRFLSLFPLFPFFTWCDKLFVKGRSMVSPRVDWG